MPTRDLYRLILWLSSLDALTEGQQTLTEGQQTILKDYKRKVRARNKAIPERRIVKDYGDGSYIELFPLPEKVRSNEAANQYFLKHEYIEFVPGPYDCTGRKFTVWYKTFRRNGRFYAYHSVGLDV